MEGSNFSKTQQEEIVALVHEGISHLVEKQKEKFVLLRNILSNKKVFEAVSQLTLIAVTEDASKDGEEPIKQEDDKTITDTQKDETVEEEPSTTKEIIDKEPSEQASPNNQVTSTQKPKEEPVREKPTPEEAKDEALAKGNSSAKNLTAKISEHKEPIQEEAQPKEEESKEIRSTKGQDKHKLPVKMSVAPIKIPPKLILHKQTEFPPTTHINHKNECDGAKQIQLLNSPLSPPTKNEVKAAIYLEKKRADLTSSSLPEKHNPALTEVMEKSWNIRISKTIEHLISQPSLTNELKTRPQGLNFSRANRGNFFRTAVTSREKKGTFQLGDTIQIEMRYSEDDAERRNQSVCTSLDNKEDKNTHVECWTHRSSKESIKGGNDETELVNDVKLDTKELKERISMKKSTGPVQLLATLNTEKLSSSNKQSEEHKNEPISEQKTTVSNTETADQTLVKKEVEASKDKDILQNAQKGEEIEFQIEIVKVETEEEKLPEIQEEPDENKEESEDDNGVSLKKARKIRQQCSREMSGQLKEDSKAVNKEEVLNFIKKTDEERDSNILIVNHSEKCKEDAINPDEAKAKSKRKEQKRVVYAKNKKEIKEQPNTEANSKVIEKKLKEAKVEEDKKGQAKNTSRSAEKGNRETIKTTNSPAKVLIREKTKRTIKSALNNRKGLDNGKKAPKAQISETNKSKYRVRAVKIIKESSEMLESKEGVKRLNKVLTKELSDLKEVINYFVPEMSETLNDLIQFSFIYIIGCHMQSFSSTKPSRRCCVS
eukprot:TRINITY_DN3496_c0_g2_i3.p1 TRINITY_DN3496_c0_g2~~TRINITY_DN3496_c0_g2_i3.p1  ORF type:complete len:771 (-),score=153.16 TRINITY_DN3496_c0_g2_i3:1001-3313(-)